MGLRKVCKPMSTFSSECRIAVGHIMLIPVVCFTCGKTIAHLHTMYSERRSSGVTHADACAELQIKRMCCKRMLISHVDIASFITTQRYEDAADAVTRFTCSVHKERDVKCD